MNFHCAGNCFHSHKFSFCCSASMSVSVSSITFGLSCFIRPTKSYAEAISLPYFTFLWASLLNIPYGIRNPSPVPCLEKWQRQKAKLLLGSLASIKKSPFCLYCVVGPSLKLSTVSTVGLFLLNSIETFLRCPHIPPGPWFNDPDTVQNLTLFFSPW